MISTNLYLFFAFQAEERTDVHVERGRRGGGTRKQKMVFLVSRPVNSVIRYGEQLCLVGHRTKANELNMKVCTIETSDHRIRARDEC